MTAEERRAAAVQEGVKALHGHYDRDGYLNPVSEEVVADVVDAVVVYLTPEPIAFAVLVQAGGQRWLARGFHETAGSAHDRAYQLAHGLGVERTVPVALVPVWEVEP